MPAFKTNAAEFTDDEVKELVEYVLKLRGAPADPAAASRGKDNFSWCVDCHGKDARGVSAVGGPSLLSAQLQYGATREALFQSIAQGRAGVCPAWQGVLDQTSILNLAAFLAARQR